MMKVLIVDDNPKASVIAKARLAKEKLDIICVEDGKSALAAARQNKPDLILLDIDMPEMSGFEVCKILKNDTELCMIPVIFLTAWDDNKSRVKGLDLGAEDYVTKPFDAFELRARVRAVLRTKQLQDQLSTLNRELEARVEKRTAEIQQLLQQKDVFVNQLSHDLKTPLTPLVALLPMIEKRTDDPKSKKMLNLVMKNVGYMKNLTEMILALARLNAPSVKLNLEKVDISGEIQNIITSLSTVFKKHGLSIVNNIVSPVVLNADRILIKELLHNLVSNAIKYTDGRGTVTFDSFLDGDNMMVFSVTDTGMGMTSEQIEHVFEEFYKADDSRNDRSSTGLGLTLCRRIVEKHGGSIWAESPGPGNGTTMNFTLPNK